MALVALRDTPLGAVNLKAGDEVPQEVRDKLPPRRIRQLCDYRYLEERDPASLDSLTEQVGELSQRLAAVEAKLDATPVKRGPGRPKKED